MMTYEEFKETILHNFPNTWWELSNHKNFWVREELSNHYVEFNTATGWWIVGYNSSSGTGKTFEEAKNLCDQNVHGKYYKA
jgi:hypothetical protein